jgi:DNA-directed RNA polymerase specialized sigma subunit
MRRLDLSVLPPRQRAVIETLYGLRGKPKTAKETAALLGVSPQHICGLRARALETLRRYYGSSPEILLAGRRKYGRKVTEGRIWP